MCVKARWQFWVRAKDPNPFEGSLVHPRRNRTYCCACQFCTDLICSQPVEGNIDPIQSGNSQENCCCVFRRTLTLRPDDFIRDVELDISPSPIRTNHYRSVRHALRRSISCSRTDKTPIRITLARHGRRGLNSGQRTLCRSIISEGNEEIEPRRRPIFGRDLGRYSIGLMTNWNRCSASDALDTRS